MLGKPGKLGGEVDRVFAHHSVQLPVNLQISLLLQTSSFHWRLLLALVFVNIEDIMNIVGIV